jgi:hypothetical protein
MPYDLMLFPDTYEQSVSQSGIPTFKATGFVLGLDGSDKVVATSQDEKLIATSYLKTLLTKKGSSLTAASEGTILPYVLSYPKGYPEFEADVIAAALDAEKQTKDRLSSLDSQIQISLAKASVVRADSETGYISIMLLTSDNKTASVVIPGKRL